MYLLITIVRAIGVRTLVKRWGRIFGLCHIETTNNGYWARFTWGEVSSGKGFALALCSFEDHFSLHLHLWQPNIFITLPFLSRWHREPHDMMETWGFSFHANDVHLNWGNKTKVINMPWALDWYRSSHLRYDGTWRHEYPNRRMGDDTRDWKKELPYRYVTKSGKVQEVIATITVEETEWRPRMTKWTRRFAKVRRCIDVSFSKGVGEGVDSWKGGVYGTGWKMLPGETPEEALRRMEREAKFR